MARRPDPPCHIVARPGDADHLCGAPALGRNGALPTCAAFAAPLHRAGHNPDFCPACDDEMTRRGWWEHPPPDPFGGQG